MPAILAAPFRNVSYLYQHGFYPSAKINEESIIFLLTRFSITCQYVRVRFDTRKGNDMSEMMQQVVVVSIAVAPFVAMGIYGLAVMIRDRF